MLNTGEVYQTQTGQQLKIVEIDSVSVCYYRRGSNEFCTRKCLISWFEYQNYQLVRDSLGSPIH